MNSVHRLAKTLQSKMLNWELGKPRFSDPRYYEHSFDVNCFSEFAAPDTSQRICYVDGGNLSVFSSPSVMLSLTRVGFCIYEGRKKVQPKNFHSNTTFFTITTSFRKDGDLYFRNELQPTTEPAPGMLPDEKDLIFYSFDQTLKQGQRMASLYSISLAARAFAEWSLSKYLIENVLLEEDILVRDGSLQTTITGEADYANRAYRAALANNIRFTGLSKTSTLYTDTGMPLFSAISILSKRNHIGLPWYYYPIVDIEAPDHRARMYAVNLHTKSKHVFRFEILKDQDPAYDPDILKVLAANSKDIAFPGYPYGLIEADRVARVRHEEVDSLKIQILSEISRLGVWDELESFLRATDAHEFLDSI